MSSIRIGVSSCLLGEKVRYDGGDKRQSYIAESLANVFTLVPVCPEVGAGMTVPREPMRLEGDPKHPKLVTIGSRIDLTDQMLRFCQEKVLELEKEDLCGFIFKKNSPSSGLFGVKVFRDGRSATGSGLFAAAVVRHFPHLPVEEEGRLEEPSVRDNFLERVFAYRRWKDLLAAKPDLAALVRFHTRHKLVMMAHSPALYREIGRLVGEGHSMELDELLRRYEELFMKALSLQATVRKQTNVLQHVMGYFKKELNRAEKEELTELIEKYHEQLVPLSDPIALLQRYVRKYHQQYLEDQLYLFPDQEELLLRQDLHTLPR